MRSGDCMAPRTGRQSRVYMYGVVAANSRVFSRVLIIDRSTSAKLVLLRIPFLFFSSSFLFLSLAFYSSLPSYLQETYLADGDDRVTENSLDRGRYAQNVPLSSTMHRLVCTNNARRGTLASECCYCLTKFRLHISGVG